MNHINSIMIKRPVHKPTKARESKTKLTSQANLNQGNLANYNPTYSKKTTITQEFAPYEHKPSIATFHNSRQVIAASNGPTGSNSINLSSISNIRPIPKQIPNVYLH